MKKTWITKYGYPQTRKQIEHEDDECAACVAAGPIHERGILYVEIEAGDGSKIIRRVEGLGDEPGLHINEYGISWSLDRMPRVGCRIVSREQVDREIAEAVAHGWYHEEEASKP
jgi:hypothetical protein